MRHLAVALLAFVVLTASANAAEPEEPQKPEADDTKSALPATFEKHGIIGRITLPDGIAVLDSDVLSQMRDRLVAYMLEDKK